MDLRQSAVAMICTIAFGTNGFSNPVVGDRARSANEICVGV